MYTGAHTHICDHWKKQNKKSAIYTVNITNVKFTPQKCENKSSRGEFQEVLSTQKLNDKKNVSINMYSELSHINILFDLIFSRCELHEFHD